MNHLFWDGGREGGESSFLVEDESSFQERGESSFLVRERRRRIFFSGVRGVAANLLFWVERRGCANLLSVGVEGAANLLFCGRGGESSFLVAGGESSFR